MKRADVDVFEKLAGQLMGVYDELSILSKKKPDDAVSEFKLRFVNTLLSRANQFLGEKYRPFDDFTEFDQDDMPQNGDVVFILSQYLQCFEKLRADNTARMGQWHWVVDPERGEKTSGDGKVHIPTVRPKRLRE